MEITHVPDLSKRKKADLLVLPFWTSAKNPHPAAEFKTVISHLTPLLHTGDFIGKEGEVALFYAEGIAEGRVLLVGLGEPSQLTKEKLRRAYAAALKSALQKKYGALNVLLPAVKGWEEEDIARGVAEGLFLTNYLFDTHKEKAKNDRDQPPKLIQKFAFIGLGAPGFAEIEKAAAVCDGVYLARDLVNGNADDVTPQYLAKVAQGFAKTLKHVETVVFDKKRIEKEKMGLLLAVNRGSFREPVLIISSYRGNPKSKDHTILVGKGVTFDTGGLNLKPTGGMETMRGDMAGAAVALGTLMAVSELGLKINLTVVIPSTENAIDALSFKPGDTYKSYSGKTVEIGNTDAEGRLILADALAYACDKLKPTRVLDIATLTGAMEIAMGPEGFGFMSNDDSIANGLLAASAQTGERAVRFPLVEEYKESLKSDIADLRNVAGRPGGALIAAIFLQQFIGTMPWAHLDIAPVDYFAESRRYHPKNGTGIGVRLLVEYLSQL
jgi:leucyl aminopeptidase